MSELAELRYHHAWQLENLRKDMEAKFSQEISELKSSVEFTWAMVEDIKKELK